MDTNIITTEVVEEVSAVAEIEVTSDVQLQSATRAMYEKLYQDGKLIYLRIRMWGMKAKLNASDVGITESIPDIVNLGNKLLIKPEVRNKFKNLESRARNYLYKQSLEFNIAEAHFVPKAKVVEVRQKLNEYKTEWNELCQEFFDNYATYRQQMLDSYPEYAESLEESYPVLGDIQPRFGFEVKMYEMVMPSELGEIDVQDVLDRQEAKTEARNEYLAVLRTDLADHQKELTQFIESSAIVIRSNIVEVCNHLSSKINKKEIISKASINAIKEQIKDFRSLNFINDRTMELELNALEKLVLSGADYKDNAEALTSLQTSLSRVVATAQDTTDIANISGEYFRDIEVD